MATLMFSSRTYKLTFLAALLAAMPLVAADEPADWIKAIKQPVKEPSKQQLNPADDDDLNTASPENEYGTLNTMSPVNMKNHAAEHLKQGHYDAAIKLVEASLEKEPGDNDARQIYADALEQKLKAQGTPDPVIFNRCVKQWYYLYKNAEFSDIITTAANHLRLLTGKSPYVWPTARMYFKHVLKPEFGPETSGEIGGKNVASEEPQQVR